jgi:hypothetical protein
VAKALPHKIPQSLEDVRIVRGAGGMGAHDWDWPLRACILVAFS